MESIIHKIRFTRHKMGPAERKIADYILENTQNIISDSIGDFAKKCDFMLDKRRRVWYYNRALPAGGASEKAAGKNL